MDAVDRVRAAARKRSDVAAAECVAVIKFVRDMHIASAANHRAEAERLEQEAADLEAEKHRLLSSADPKR